MTHPRNLMCPKCRAGLQAVLQDTVEVDTCPKCGGVWVDAIEGKQALQIKPEVFTVDELRQLRTRYSALGRVEEVKYHPCPVCHQLMWRKNWGSHSGVIVDYCKEHGAWYDAEELAKVREFISAGGIELEKLKMTEKGLMRLESKLTQESLRLDQRIDSAYRRARIWSMLGF